MLIVACRRLETYNRQGFIYKYYTFGEGYGTTYCVASDVEVRIDMTLGRKSSSGAVGTETYASLCKKYGDLKPGGWSYTSEDYMQPVALAESVYNIVITSDCDWDAEHPAGESLNDLFKVYYTTYYPFISGGWVGFEYVTFVDIMV